VPVGPRTRTAAVATPAALTRTMVLFQDMA
jgi:hypothetical protein